MATYLTVDPKNPLNGKPVGTSLEELQQEVGGLIELVYLPNDQIMVIDEEGLLKNKPLNPEASVLTMGIIAGDVVIADSKEID